MQRFNTMYLFAMICYSTKTVRFWFCNKAIFFKFASTQTIITVVYIPIAPIAFQVYRNIKRRDTY